MNFLCRAKKTASVEPLADKSTLHIAELGALEERLADVAKEARLPDELTGMEDANLVITKLAKMKTMFGFREVVKFKRRSRYLEFFVIVSEILILFLFDLVPIRFLDLIFWVRFLSASSLVSNYFFVKRHFCRPMSVASFFCSFWPYECDD